MLEINNLNKSFDFNYILHDINLNVSENEIVQISGINGSGKSTFLKIISGILKPESGTISIINKNLLSRDCQPKKHIIYWGHNPMLYPHLTTYENITFFLKIRNQNLPENIDVILDEVNLLDLKHSKCEKFSQGMFQRFNLLRFMLSDWRLGLMDEPLNGLDSNGEELLLKKMQSWKDDGRSIIVTSHNSDKLKDLISSIYELKDKKLIKI